MNDPQAEGHMASHIERRKFLATLGGAAAAWPLSARAQQPTRVPRIGIVDDAPMWHSFRQALREFGYVKGQSINYEYRYSEGMPDRLAAVMGERSRARKCRSHYRRDGRD
jgi:putative tryptophan/tyrosine transport system substrate-binding protein